MSSFLPGSGKRDVYVKDSGNDDDSGESLLFSVADLHTASNRTLSLDPVPSLFAPASVVDVGASRYVEPNTIQFPDNVQAALQFSALSTEAGTWAGGVLLKASANAQSSWLTISTSSLSGDVAYSTDGKSRVSLDARAIILNGANQKGSHITGATSEAFQDIGQALARYGNSIILDIDATGAKPRYYQYNEINVEGDNCIAVRCNTPASGIAAFNFGAITYETGLTGTGAGCIAFKIIDGSMAGYCVEIDMERVADIGASGFLVLHNIIGRGSIINEGKLTYASNDYAGNISNLGEASFDITEMAGSFSNYGQANYSANKMTGDISNVGTLTITINEHSGTIFNTGILNGEINGIRYGTWNQGTEFLGTFAKSGFVTTSFDGMGYITLNGSTDTIDSFVIYYRQNTALSRTVDFQLVNASNGTVYRTGTATNAAIGSYQFSVSTVVNPLPASNTTMQLQIKASGSQISDVSASLYFTRI